MMKGLLIALLTVSAGTWASAANDPTNEVNPFIGTANGGNTFPGAVRPWGMVSVSPHNAPGAPSGYLYGQEYFYGFGHVHLSGTGCAELGSVVLAFTRGALRFGPDDYRCRYADESASPGTYRVRLVEPRITAEVTATRRCGLTRISSPADGPVNIFLDVGRSLALLGGGEIKILSSTEAEGFAISGGFCGETNRERIYFHARISTPSDSSGLWIGNLQSTARSASVRDTAIGAWFRCPMAAHRPVVIAVGISYVSVQNARENLDREVGSRPFDDIRLEARAEWKEALSRIEVEGGSPADRIKFTTALYHLLIHPNVISDVNGEYPLPGQSAAGRYKDRERYTVFSLWDTYRTLHPFLALVYPERQSEMVRTMIDIAGESGWLPKWELASNETHLMVGDPAVPVIAETYLAGITDFNVHAAYEAMKKAALTAGPESDPERPGYHDELRYHYIPFEQDTTAPWWVWGPVSTTLEYCYDDWMIAQMAGQLASSDEQAEFFRRSQYFRNLFDPATLFMRPRLKNGAWLIPFDPNATEGSGSWSGSGGPGFVEGNAWQYTWFVPHGVDTLIRLFGGNRPFAEKLAECFSAGKFTINNEPDIAYPYLFDYVKGEEYRTPALVRRIMANDFGVGAEGLPGNDDCGTISAWFVFSALGFYPACPGSGTYQLGLPLFDRAKISLNRKYYPGNEFTIEFRSDTSNLGGLQPPELNGNPLKEYSIRHQDVIQGGTLIFRVTGTPPDR